MKTFLLLLMFLITAGHGAYADVDAGQQVASEDLSEDMSVLKNPFLSQIPVEQKAQAPVETPPAKPDEQYKAPLPLPVTRTAKAEPVHQAEIEEEPPSFVVQGFIWGSDKPKAIINGRIVKIGDRVEGAQIIAIEKKGITVLLNGRNFTIGTQQ